MTDADGSRVALPPQVRRPFDVFVNGVPQEEGRDYRVDGDELAFPRRLVPPRPDTSWSLVRNLLFGRYRTEHTVDVSYRGPSGPVVVSGLRILR